MVQIQKIICSSVSIGCALRKIVISLMVIAISGCASLPKDYPRTASTVFDDYSATSGGELVKAAAVEHPGQSGFAIIRRGRNAFTSRIALNELAEKSLDIQYYIWADDTTGWILANRVKKAADRGVRVRILVDDINLSGRDNAVASLDAHPNIEIRIFNPFVHRRARVIDFTTDLGRVNHRMHNKIMIMDNSVAIVGGRNIGNHYFGVDTEANFRDLDIAAIGPVVQDVSKVFDYFWNGDWAVPISVLVKEVHSEADMEASDKKRKDLIAKTPYPYPLDEDIEALKSELEMIRNDCIWAPGRIVWDDPAALAEGSEKGSIIKDIYQKFNAAEKEIYIESAYFVVLEPGVEFTNKLINRGVRIRALTNSLASNDVVAAHAGYAKQRKALIMAGMELYELRPDAGKTQKNLVSVDSKAALHTKAMVIDRKAVYIGSFNLDPRSSDINTEATIYIENPELAEQVIAYMDEGVRPENSYRVLLDEDDDLVWVTENEGHEIRYHKEPETSFWQRFVSGFIKILPVEGQL